MAASIAVLAVAVALLTLSHGHPRLVLLVVLTTALFLATVWSIGLRLGWLTALLLASTALILGILAGTPILGAIAAIVLVAWIALGSQRRLDPAGLTPLEALPEALGEASENVAASEAIAFERVGAISFDHGSGRPVVGVVLLGPGADRYAVVTDLVVAVQSVFGHRVLLTQNSGVVPPPPECLANHLHGADVAELAAAHERALAVLRSRGLTPDRLSAERHVDLHVAVERRALDWYNGRRGPGRIGVLFSSGKGAGPLDEGDASERRIDAWLTAPAPVP